MFKDESISCVNVSEFTIKLSVICVFILSFMFFRIVLKFERCSLKEDYQTIQVKKRKIRKPKLKNEIQKDIAYLKWLFEGTPNLI